MNCVPVCSRADPGHSVPRLRARLSGSPAGSPIPPRYRLPVPGVLERGERADSPDKARSASLPDLRQSRADGCWRGELCIAMWQEYRQAGRSTSWDAMTPNRVYFVALRASRGQAMVCRRSREGAGSRRTSQGLAGAPQGLAGKRDHPGFPAPSLPSELGCRVELSLGCSYYS